MNPSSPSARGTGIVKDVFTGIGLIFFVRHWVPGLLLWSYLLVVHPAYALGGLAATLLCLLFHRLFRVLLDPLSIILMLLNGFLTGLALIHFRGVPGGFEGAAAFITVLFAHQIIYYLLYALLVRQLRLPILSLPFVFATWLLMGLPRDVGGPAITLWSSLVLPFQSILEGSIPHGLSVFGRSLSALFFVGDPLPGLLVAGMMLWYSRITFSLATASFLVLAVARPILPADPTFELLAFNCMATVIMVGAILEVPSRWSYRNAALFGVFSVVLSVFLASLSLPLLNFPFILAVMTFVLSKPLIAAEGALPFDFTSGTPEQNLYYAQNRRDRYAGVALASFSLPFNGTWKVTQAHRGAYTHKVDWQHAWDFEIVDESGNFSRNGSTSLFDFYAYRQPVCAALDGEVINLQSYIPDNPPGEFNFSLNWGNTVVLRHPDGTCSAYSHLSYMPETLFIGKWVHKGEVIGYCGNSGRSDRPHLHFQFQKTGKIGEKTLAVPLKKYVRINGKGAELRVCHFPEDGEVIRNIAPSVRMGEVFHFPYGREMIAAGQIDGRETIEHWVSTVDFYNHTYLYCHETNAVAYFFVEDGVFYFTDYFGPRSSLLNVFSLAASKVVFAEDDALEYVDQLQLNRLAPAFSHVLADVLSPLVTVKETMCHYRIGVAENRTLTIQNRIVTSTRLGGFARHTPATLEIELPYGLQSLRVQGSIHRQHYSFTISMKS